MVLAVLYKRKHHAFLPSELHIVNYSRRGRLFEVHNTGVCVKGKIFYSVDYIK